MSRRVERSVVWQVEAPAAEVFPLLCPVREHEWIEGWEAETVHSASGVAEEGAVFRVRAPGGGQEEVWMVARHEVPRRVDYDVVGPGQARRLSLLLTEPRPGRTRVEVRHSLTALEEDAVAGLVRDVEARAARLASLEAPLGHFLRTGAMLRVADARRAAQPSSASGSEARGSDPASR